MMRRLTHTPRYATVRRVPMAPITAFLYVCLAMLVVVAAVVGTAWTVYD
jgi:UPF0716 family protein affecting phage T7 exclusion